MQPEKHDSAYFFHKYKNKNRELYAVIWHFSHSRHETECPLTHEQMANQYEAFLKNPREVAAVAAAHKNHFSMQPNVKAILNAAITRKMEVLAAQSTDPMSDRHELMETLFFTPTKALAAINEAVNRLRAQPSPAYNSPAKEPPKPEPAEPPPPRFAAPEVLRDKNFRVESDGYVGRVKPRQPSKESKQH